MTYEVLFFNGWGELPTYYLIHGVEGETPEKALAANLERIVREVRDRLELSEDQVRDEAIHQAIYVLRPNGLVSVADTAR